MPHTNLIASHACFWFSLLCLCCAPQGRTDTQTPSEDGQSITKASPEAKTTKALIGTLAKGFQTSKFQRELYHKVLRQTPRDPNLRDTITALETQQFSDPTEITVLNYLKGLQSPGRTLPKVQQTKGAKRTPTMLEHISELCAISPQFSQRVHGTLGDRTASFCPEKSENKGFDVTRQDLPSLIGQGLNTQSASTAKGLLLLATIDDPSAGYALITVPPLNLGQPSKQLGMLSPLQLATIAWSIKDKNRASLRRVIENETLDERLFVRAALALAWHKDPAIHTKLPRLYTLERKSPNAIPKEILTRILSELDDTTTLQNVFRTIYQQTSLSDAVLSKIGSKRLSLDFLGTLISEALVASPSHAKAWVHLKDPALLPKVAWSKIFDANQDEQNSATLIRNLSRLKAPIPLTACKSLKSRFFQTAKDHTRDALIDILHRSQCLTTQDLEAEATLGTRSAIILKAVQTNDPNTYFLRRLRGKERGDASRVCEALIRHPKLVDALAPKVGFAKAIAQHLKTTKDSFPFLRLLTMLVKTSKPGDRLRMEPVLITALTPYIDGRAGGIHSDALVILEKIDSPKSVAQVLKVLKGLDKGTTREKLMLRFGHLLSRSAQ